jgi:hypothetical protein
VPHVLLAAPRRDLYQLPTIRCAATCYHTRTTVRVQDGDRAATLRQERVWCLPTAQDWQEVERRYTAWQAAFRGGQHTCLPETRREIKMTRGLNLGMIQF